jgi:hypothetical protein
VEATGDFVQPGQPQGWYRHPSEPYDYYWTGHGFGTVQGTFVRRRHRDGSPDFETATDDQVSQWIGEHGVDEAAGAAATITKLPLSQIRFDWVGGALLLLSFLITWLVTASVPSFSGSTFWFTLGSWLSSALVFVGCAFLVAGLVRRVLEFLREQETEQGDRGDRS